MRFLIYLSLWAQKIYSQKLFYLTNLVLKLRCGLDVIVFILVLETKIYQNKHLDISHRDLRFKTNAMN